MQGRGSKREGRRGKQTRWIVAPHAGAWIETAGRAAPAAALPRSPLMQGRGSKHGWRLLRRRDGSPLMQGRGSKPERAATGRLRPVVAPHAGAWIETMSAASRSEEHTSELQSLMGK